MAVRQGGLGSADVEKRDPVTDGEVSAGRRTGFGRAAAAVEHELEENKLGEFPGDSFKVASLLGGNAPAVANNRVGHYQTFCRAFKDEVIFLCRAKDKTQVLVYLFDLGGALAGHGVKDLLAVDRANVLDGQAANVGEDEFADPVLNILAGDILDAALIDADRLL